MKSLVVATFEYLQNANNAIEKLFELDQLGDIVLCDLVLIRKQGENSFEFMYHNGPDAEYLPDGGLITGLLVGAIGDSIDNNGRMILYCFFTY